MLCITLLTFQICFFQSGPVKVDPALPIYVRESGIVGGINSVGSDTLNNLMALWAEGFRKEQPGVNLQVEGKGSATAPPALAEGTAQLGPMSRPMKAEELEQVERRLGYLPTAIGVGLDALAVYVHEDNPLEAVSLEQLDAIFSRTRWGGYGEEIRLWSDLDLDGSLAAYPISLYGRNSASGTYGYFKTHALFKGDFKARVKEQPGSASVVMAVTEDRAGIGYSGIGYQTSGVKVLHIVGESGRIYSPSAENVLSGRYPLGRMLLVYVNKPPREPLPPIIAAFLRYVLSRQGQEMVAKAGYIPLPAELAAQQLERLTGGLGRESEQGDTIRAASEPPADHRE